MLKILSWESDLQQNISCWQTQKQDSYFTAPLSSLYSAFHCLLLQSLVPEQILVTHLKHLTIKLRFTAIYILLEISKQQKWLFSTVISICNLLFTCSMVDDSIHLFLGGRLLVLYQVFISSSDAPAIWFRHAWRKWPTTWWLKVLPIGSACPIKNIMLRQSEHWNICVF